MNRLLTFVSRPGSTRHLAVIRMGLVAAAWSEWASARMFYKATSLPDLLVTLVFFLSTTTAFFGWFSRVSMGVAGATAMGLVYGYGLYGEVDTYWHNHCKVLAHAMLLTALVPCGNLWSVDRWLQVRRAERHGEPIPSSDGDGWATRLLCFAEATVWFWGAADKLSVKFLSGDRMLQIIVSFYPVLAGWLAVVAPVLTVVSVLTVLLEFALPLGLWFRRARPLLMGSALLLHGSFYVLLPVGTFSVTMIVLLLAWFDPDEIDALWRRLDGTSPGP